MKLLFDHQVRKADDIFVVDELPAQPISAPQESQFYISIVLFNLDAQNTSPATEVGVKIINKLFSTSCYRLRSSSSVSTYMAIKRYMIVTESTTERSKSLNLQS
ncbi:hypothetical protein AVEN_153853-1 [Araneus ventricosus]|uniref:Uncharacterized protein n=1 Tax=Araneus ventricosus TaxID=182803 RepID=A0A4Y2N462_ARAVE|nr:hypothetical protein AVEN_153853-1 [Araneus ventricosus]